jgi:hypothetical protein
VWWRHGDHNGPLNDSIHFCGRGRPLTDDVVGGRTRDHHSDRVHLTCLVRPEMAHPVDHGLARDVMVQSGPAGCIESKVWHYLGAGRGGQRLDADAALPSRSPRPGSLWQKSKLSIVRVNSNLVAKGDVEFHARHVALGWVFHQELDPTTRFLKKSADRRTDDDRPCLFEKGLHLLAVF